MPAEGSLPIETDVQTVARMLQEQAEFHLLDCRESSEHAIASIEHASLLPMSEIQARLGELEPLRGQHVVVHCHHGGRSLQVARWLSAQGFSRVQSMAGGIDAWSLEVDPSVPRY